jgi:hypothetical protein
VRVVDPAVAEKFAVLRRDSRPEDGLHGTGATHPSGADPAMARFATVSASGARYYVVPAEAGACLATDKAGVTTCVTTRGGEPVASFGIAFCGAEVPDGMFVIAGLFSDGAERVHAIRSGGPRFSAPVANNVAVLEIPKSAGASLKGLSWEGAGNSGERLGQLMPPGADGGCARPSVEQRDAPAIR